MDCLMFVVLALLLVLAWKKGLLYYHSLQFPGPFTLPFVMTSSTLLKSLRKGYYEKIVNLCQSYPAIFKIWIANDLYIVNSQPEDVELILNKFCDKAPFYKLWDPFLKSTLFTAPVAVWKERRRRVNCTFNYQIIASFYGIFAKYAEEMVRILEKSCGKEQTALMPEFFKQTMDAAIETLVGIEPNSLEDRYSHLPLILRGEKIVMGRLQKLWLYFDWTFNFSRFKKEVDKILEITQFYGEKAFLIKKQGKHVDDLGLKRFSNRLLDLYDKGFFGTKTDIIHEQAMTLVAASETTSIAITSVILMLALSSEAQEKIYKELSSPNQDISLEDITRMDYLERVIKEALRLHPVAPAVMRHIDKNIRLGSYFYPAGSNVIVPIFHIHRRPDLWPNPSKFDPDRFLPEEVAKRPRCAYIPFSFGSRNCIGPQYAMLSMKVALAHIVKRFKVKAVNYESFDDLELDLHILTQPKGYRVMFEKREM